MQTFDRLKIVAAIDAIDVVDESVFAKTLVNGNVVSMKYYREVPTKLMIKVDYASGEVVVEFTGKILGHNYPHLISMANIEECFINIESLGFCRFEINLNSKEQIRNALHIEDTNLLTVLNSETNPILEFMDEAVCGSQGQKACSDWKSYQRYLVLKDCDFDLEKVEAKVRSLYKRGTKISDVMRPYREAYSQLMTEGEDTYFSEILAMLR